MRKNLVSETDDLSGKAGLWNSVIKKRGGIFDGLFELTPEIIEQIEKDSEERQKRIKECAAKGHPNSISQGTGYFRDTLTAYMHCKSCGDYYHRNPTIKEQERFARTMNYLVD